MTEKIMSVINFDSENLVVDWISFNLEGLPDPERIARRLFSRFNASIPMEFFRKSICRKSFL